MAQRPRCGACKRMNTKCTEACVFAPFFPPQQPEKFQCVHYVFGSSNVKKMLNAVDFDQREAAVNSLVYEARARINDPVNGCLNSIFRKQQEIDTLREDNALLRDQLAPYIGYQGLFQRQPTQQEMGQEQRGSAFERQPMQQEMGQPQRRSEFETQHHTGPMRRTQQRDFTFDTQQQRGSAFETQQHMGYQGYTQDMERGLHHDQSDGGVELWRSNVDSEFAEAIFSNTTQPSLQQQSGSTFDRQQQRGSAFQTHQPHVPHHHSLMTTRTGQVFNLSQQQPNLFTGQDIVGVLQHDQRDAELELGMSDAHSEFVEVLFSNTTQPSLPLPPQDNQTNSETDKEVA